MESLSTVYSGTFGGRAGGIPTIPYNQLGQIREGVSSAPGSSMGSFFSGNAGSGAMSLLLSGSSLASSGLAYYGARQSGKLQEAALKLQASQQKMQARQIEINAASEVNVIRNKLLDDIASSQAFFSASGVDTSSGSAAAILNKSIKNAREDISNVREQGAISSQGMYKQAKQTGIEAKYARKAGNLRSYEALTGAIKPAGQLYGSLRSLLNG